jgi:hypothetical protein
MEVDASRSTDDRAVQLLDPGSDVNREPLSSLDRIVLRRIGLAVILLAVGICALAYGHPFVGFFFFFWAFVYAAITIFRMWALLRGSELDRREREH